MVDSSGNYQAGNLLQYCVVEYAGNGDKASVNITSQMIDYCSVRHNQLRGIQAVGTSSANGWVTHNEIFDHDIYDYNGGGIYAKYAYIAGNTIYRNAVKAAMASGWSGYGGGIYAINSTVTANNVHDNTASYGGGIYVENSTVLMNTVSNNQASDNYGSGGGIRSKNSLISKNTIKANTARSSYGTGRGGGVYAAGGTVDGNLVSGNVANSESGDTIFTGNAYGGGIYASSATVTNNTVTANKAYSTKATVSMKGGGIYAEDGTVKQNQISFNSVQGTRLFGSGLYTLGDTNVTQNTFAYNSSYGAPTGAYYIWGVSSFHYNWFIKNTYYDVSVGSSSDVDGTLNYWQVTESTDILNQVFDWYDNSALGKLLYNPFLTAPDDGAPQPPIVYFNYISVVTK